MRDVIIGIQEDIEQGRLTFQQIANKHRVPLDWVDIACGELMENYQEAEAEKFFDQGFHDHLERDHDEAYEPDCDSWYDEQYEIDY